MTDLSSVKNWARSLQHCDALTPRLAYRASKGLWSVRTFIVNAKYRHEIVTKLTARNQLHQLSNETAPDRYPAIFRACANHFSAADAIKVLSFGCSTGEEVFSLRQYLPHAELVGVDINRRNIRTCRSRPEKDDRMSFYRSDGTDIPDPGLYDAIFCMAVLQRTQNRDPETADSSAVYPFARFDAQVETLDRLLVPGGLFAIHHSDYRFEDASVARRYLPLRKDFGVLSGRKYFDRNNRRVERQFFNPVIFVKR